MPDLMVTLGIMEQLPQLRRTAAYCGVMPTAATILIRKKFRNFIVDIRRMAGVDGRLFDYKDADNGSSTSARLIFLEFMQPPRKSYPVLVQIA
jgi:hypothetical protein